MTVMPTAQMMVSRFRRLKTNLWLGRYFGNILCVWLRSAPIDRGEGKSV